MWVGGIKEKAVHRELTNSPWSTVTFLGKHNLEIPAWHGGKSLSRIRAHLNPGIICCRYKTISLVSLVDIKSKQALINYL